MTETQRTNWPVIIKEILEALELANPRVSALNTLSKMMHRDYRQVERWIAGGEPKHYEGEMLLAIHREYARPCDCCELHALISTHRMHKDISSRKAQ